MTTNPMRVMRRAASAVLVAASALPAVASGQTWTGVLSGQGAVPASESSASSTVTLTLSGTTLLVQMSWQDLMHFPQSLLLFASPPQHGADRSAVALGLRGFSPTQSGSHSELINLTEASAYAGNFLRAHGGRAEAARAALVAALDSGYFAIVTQPGSRIELGAPLAKVHLVRGTSSPDGR